METELITTAQMYWLTRLTPLGNALEGFTGLGYAAMIVLFVVGIFLQDDMFEKGVRAIALKLLRASPCIGIVATLLLIATCLLPTTREMAAILIVPRIANSEKVQTVGNQLYDLAVEWMEELRPAKNKNGSGK